MSVQAAPQARADAQEDGANEGRIPFRLRIGVTGHRELPEAEELRKAVRDAIDLAVSKSGYPKDGLPSTPLRLTVVSALAEGADRLVVREVLEPEGEKREGSNLVCVLPVAEESLGLYRDDFTSEGSRQEFEELRERAWRQIPAPLELVPQDATQDQRDAGYLWAGKEVVRNCDVLIAIWDGQPPRGVGGTADLIHWARERDMGRARPEPAPGTREGPARQASAALLDSLAVDEATFGALGPLRIIISTKGDHEPFVDDGPPWDLAARAIQERLKSDLARLAEFNDKKILSAADWQRSAERTTDELIPARYRQSSPRLNDMVNHIAPHLNRVDQAAIAAQRAFRLSSYAFFGFTALATIVAAAQAIVFPGTWELTLGELALIIGSVVIISLENSWKNNNKHWFVYRFFAERLRTTCYLLAVGQDAAFEFDVGGTIEDPAQNEWVRRAFTAVLAECDVRQQEPLEDLETLSSLIRVHWMGGQVKYFERTSKKLMRQHNTVRRLLYGALGATIVAATLHALRIWPFGSGETEALIMCAIGLPAVAGALSNIRSIREFSRHAFRYARMAVVLRRYADKFTDESDIEDLRQLTVEVGDLLTAETRGWLVEVSGRGLEIHG